MLGIKDRLVVKVSHSKVLMIAKFSSSIRVPQKELELSQAIIKLKVGPCENFDFYLVLVDLVGHPNSLLAELHP